MRVVIDFPDEFYKRMEAQIPIKRPDYVKAFIADTMNKALNNLESRKKSTKES